MRAQYVVKITKFCNLRCSYCYEYPELGNPNRMSIEQLSTMFKHIAEYQRAHSSDPRVLFIWHGGEPLTIEPDYWRAVFAEQKKHLQGIQVVNDVQTNLMLLDDDRIDLIRNGFNGIGISIDIFGDLRLNMAGRPSQAKVLANMDRLREAGIEFGCITVLTRRNVTQVEKIFRFYESLGRTFRLLPLFQGAFDDQHQGYEVNAEEVLTALCKVADLWLASPTKIRIAPITEQLTNVMYRSYPDYQPSYYDRRSFEEVTIVNTNGDLYSQADAYTPGRAWGNIFRSSLDEIFATATHEQSVREAESRMAGVCLHCEYFGACTGFPVAEDKRRYPDTLRGGKSTCVVERGLFMHLQRRLNEAEKRLGSGLWEKLEELAPKESTQVEEPIGWEDIRAA
ncbi:MAG: radical SAM protein [Polyangiaceae bacterium]|nr:radical SAM protein [Polyangiaceae bacterium]